MSVNSFNPEEAENLEDIEKQFAVKAVHHLETYWKLLHAVKGSELKLTKIDDQIMTHLITVFPEYLDHEKIRVVDENEMKSPTNKPKWREFMNTYENIVADYNFGTILRVDASKGYTETNTMFVPRMQFLAIEIARNKYGLNDWVYQSDA